MRARTKKVLVAFTILLGLLGLGSFFLKPVLENRLEKYLRDKIVFEDDLTPLTFEFESLDLSLMGRKLNLHGLRIMPTPPADSSVAQAFQGLEISRISLHNIALSNFLWNKNLDITSLTLDTVRILLRKTGAPNPKGSPPAPGSGGAIMDSIRLPGLSDVRLGVFEMDHFQLLLQGPEQDTLARFAGNQLSLRGIRLAKGGSSAESLFAPALDSLELELREQRSELDAGAYALGYERFFYRHASQSLQIENLTVEPRLEPAEMRARHRYSYETYRVRMAGLQIEELDMESLFRRGELRMHSITLDSVHAGIFRDKTLPFDTGRTVKLPARALAELKFPLRIDTLQLRNSYLQYAENMPGSDGLVEVELKDLQMAFYPIVSGGVAGNEADTLHISVSTHLMGALPIGAEIQMPYGSDALSMIGHSSGSAGLHTMNHPIYPAIGMRFTGGNLNSLTFSADGNSRQMQGHLTMLYKDLEVEFLKEEGDRSKTKSFLANTLVKSSNPNRRGKTIVGVIEFERVPYKGLGNYIWKSMQSGLVNSLSPVGKHHKEKSKR